MSCDASLKMNNTCYKCRKKYKHNQKNKCNLISQHLKFDTKELNNLKIITFLKEEEPTELIESSIGYLKFKNNNIDSVFTAEENLRFLNYISDYKIGFKKWLVPRTILKRPLQLVVNKTNLKNKKNCINHYCIECINEFGFDVIKNTSIGNINCFERNKDLIK